MAETSHEPELRPARRQWLRTAGLLGAGSIAAAWLGRKITEAPPPRLRYARTIEAARHAIREAMAKSGVASVSVALVDGEQIAWQEVFGHADKARGIAPSATTMFAVGSISKLVAGIATLILVDRRQIDLDTPVVRYLRDFRMASPAYRDITVRMLLIHSSGLAGTDGRNLFTQIPVPGYAVQVQESLLTTRLKYPPGEMAIYCNDGFTLLEGIIQSVTGKPYVQFIQDELLAPLGMSHSHFPLQAFPAGSFALAYLGDTALPQECVNAYASGALYSTPTDLARLAAMLLNGGTSGRRSLLSPAAMAELHKNQGSHVRTNPLGQALGLGWDSVAHPAFEAQNIKALHKDGQTAFYSSQFFLLPVERLALILTGSSPDYGGETLAVKVLFDALTERGLAEPPDTRSAPSQPPLSPLDGAGIIGYYASNYSIFRIQADQGTDLEIATYRNLQWSSVAAGLKRAPDGTWITSTGLPSRTFAVLHDSGRDYLVERLAKSLTGEPRVEVLGQRIKQNAPLAHHWQQRTGRKWLCVNDHPQSILLKTGGPLFTLQALPALPGYLFAGYKRSIFQIIRPDRHDAGRADSVIQIPGRTGSNIDDVRIERRQGEEWLHFGSFLYCPLETVPELDSGNSTHAIGADGLAEWRRIPAGATVSIAGARYWRVFNEAMELVAASTDEQEGHPSTLGSLSYLMLFADTDEQIQLKCTVVHAT